MAASRRKSSSAGSRTTSRAASAVSRAGAGGEVTTPAALREWLGECGVPELVEWLMEALESDVALRERLYRRASRERGAVVDLARLKKAMVAATTTPHGGYVNYRASGDFCADIERACIDPLREMLAAGQAAEVVELAEFAVHRTEKAIEFVDDSGGHFTMIWDSLLEVHLAACAASRPDPVALARRLFAHAAGSGWDNFRDAPETHKHHLGKAGLAEFRRLAVEAFDALPLLQPGREEEGAARSRRFSLTMLRTSLAKASGDVDELVHVMSRDLSSPWSYCEICRVLRENKRPDDAMLWAEKGVSAFPGHQDGRLRSELAAVYIQKGRVAEAMELLWENFTIRPRPDAYAALHDGAQKEKKWPVWRKKALDYARSGARPGWGTGSAVPLLLWENSDAEAWAEAAARGCPEECWGELADRRGKTHPEDAWPVYVRLAERATLPANNQAYQQGAGWLAKAKALAIKLPQPQRSSWSAEMERIRTKYRAKRNFMAAISAL